MLLIIGLGVVIWIGLCMLFVALCASAKEGDGDEATLAPPSVGRRRRRRSAALS